MSFKSVRSTIDADGSRCNGIEPSVLIEGAGLRPAQVAVFRARPHSLQTGEVHVWLARPHHWLSRRSAAEYAKILSRDETDRMARFRFEHLRNEYLITRALCRTTLSRYADVDAANWRFAANAYGKPEIHGPGTGRRLRFNLSNVRGLVACAVSLDVDIGIDVEEIDRKVELSVAEKNFSVAEFEQLRGLPEMQMQQRFLEIWTLKESYIKARGMGLSLPLDDFSFRTVDGGIDIDFAPASNELASDWQFQQQAVGPSHLLAIAIRKGGACPFAIRIEETVP